MRSTRSWSTPVRRRTGGGRRPRRRRHDDRRISKYSIKAFEEAQEDILKLTLTNAPRRLDIPEQFVTSFLDEVQRTHPQYFSDLAPLPPDAR